jgi:hypothetical protein
VAAAGRWMQQRESLGEGVIELDALMLLVPMSKLPLRRANGRGSRTARMIEVLWLKYCTRHLAPQSVAKGLNGHLSFPRPSSLYSPLKA